MTRREKLDAPAAYVASTALAGGAVLSGIVFLYLIYLNSRGKHFTTGAAVFLYVFPAALAAVCLAGLRLRRSYRINVALFLLSTVASIYVVEIITTTWFSLPSVVSELREKTTIETARKLGLHVDARTKLAVVADLRGRGIDAYPNIPPSALLSMKTDRNPNNIGGAEFLPLAGISNKASVVCNESGEYMVYQNDEHGFHNPAGLWKNGVDIAAVGDSFVQGFCVPSDKNFVALIRNRSPSTVNLGMAGQGPLMMLATIKEYARLLKPKEVLWFYHEESSLSFLKDEMNSPLLMRYLTTGFSQGLVERQTEIDRLLATYAEAEMKGSRSSKKLEELFENIGDSRQLLHRFQGILKLYRMRSTLGLTSRDNHKSNQSLRGDLPPGVKELFAQVLLEARRSVNGWGGKVYFIYLPHRRTNWTTMMEDKKDILDLAANLGFRIVDIDRVFQAQSDPLALFALRMADHYNVDGHRLVAETILNSVPLLSRNASSQCCDRERAAISDP